MVKLIVHCGLNKAGSTYLQSMFIQSLSVLEQQGVHYPEPYDSGIGNAGVFSLALKALDMPKAKDCFDQFYESAKERNCDVLLLSSEYFFFQMINFRQRDLFFKLIQNYGIDDVKLVIVFRPIIEHAISAYSHRCGTIPLPEFETWIRGDVGDYPSSSFREEYARKNQFWYSRYEFWDSSVKLLELIDSKKLDIFPIQYSMEMKLDFDKLLGVNLVEPTHKKVNKSMTLNQAEVCRLLFEKNKLWGRSARNFFKNNADVQAAGDSLLKREYKEIVMKTIGVHISSIKALEYKLGISLVSDDATEGVPLESHLNVGEKNLVMSTSELSGVIAEIMQSISLKSRLRAKLGNFKRLLARSV